MKSPKKLRRRASLGVKGVILFGLPEAKDEFGSGAYHEKGIVQQAVRAIRAAAPDLVIMTDTCLCEYTSHGHCGVVRDGEVLNDPSLELLARTAVSQAEAGADVVAPSAMMDGQVGAIREALDEAGFEQVAIMAYAVKYASGFYGPFREAADSAPAFGDRRAYQMDAANAREAMREAELDYAEGADILMVKPATCYLDILKTLREQFDVPIGRLSRFRRVRDDQSRGAKRLDRRRTRDDGNVDQHQTRRRGHHSHLLRARGDEAAARQIARNIPNGLAALCAIFAFFAV